MTRKYIQPGEVIDYANDTGEDIAVDAVVPIGGRIGVALVAIPDGTVGSVQLSGVFEVPKVTGTAIAQGAPIDYDDSEAAVTTGLTPAAGDISGCATAFKAAASGDAVCQVLLGFPGGTVASE
ncbi:DUF2190 family protein [Algiphilus sp.]|uniref:DUF2190 family protein n=1 Tax=Algiphilus sp. TaxID=1872431 RepID=UPI0025C1B887|nr:DUF2190 family protein [Algiphilus sp.]MCK5769474.1 DUF2190 family protein [Algiphilus sp.]